MAERERRPQLAPAALRSLVDQVSLAIFVFRGPRLIYRNRTAARLLEQFRAKYGIELVVILRDQVVQFRDQERQDTAGIALTAGDKAPFVVQMLQLQGRRPDLAVSVREIGNDIAAYKKAYGLSPRELDVVELVLHGHRNDEIAKALKIAPATVKKHISSLFEKVGVASRSELAIRLA